MAYDPITGDPLTTSVIWRPRTCFLMTKLGVKAPDIVGEIRQRTEHILSTHHFSLIDAEAVTTGQDFLRKIWGLIVQVPIGIAIVYQSMPAGTMGNIFYELGLAQALGKETLVIRAPKATIPSDFVRTEFIQYGDDFEKKLLRFIGHLRTRADYYETLAESFEESNALAAIDYYRRAYLLTGRKGLRTAAKAVLRDIELPGNIRVGLDALSRF